MDINEYVYILTDGADRWLAALHRDRLARLLNRTRFPDTPSHVLTEAVDKLRTVLDQTDAGLANRSPVSLGLGGDATGPYLHALKLADGDPDAS